MHKAVNSKQVSISSNTLRLSLSITKKAILIGRSEGCKLYNVPTKKFHFLQSELGQPQVLLVDFKRVFHHKLIFTALAIMGHILQHFLTHFLIDEKIETCLHSENRSHRFLWQISVSFPKPLFSAFLKHRYVFWISLALTKKFQNKITKHYIVKAFQQEHTKRFGLVPRLITILETLFQCKTLMNKNLCFSSRKINWFVATTNLTSLKLQMCYVLFHLLIILSFKGQKVTYQLQVFFY